MAEFKRAIVQAIECLQGGLAEVDMLVEAIDSTRTELERVRDDFRATVQAEGEVAGQVLVHEVNAVEQSLRDYNTVVDSIAGYLQGFDPQYLAKGVEYLTRCEDRLNLDFLRFREAALGQRGPTTHSGLNHLYALASAGGGPALESQRQLEEVRAHAGLSTLEADPNMEVLAPALQEFYEQVLDLLASPGEGPDWLEKLLQCGKLYAQMDVQFINRLYAGGPSPLPFVNLVVHSAWLHTQGAVLPEVVQYFLCQAESALDSAREMQHQTSLSLASDAPELPIMRNAGEALSRLSEGLSAYWQWLESPSVDALEGLAQPVLDQAGFVRISFDELNDLATRGDRVRCTICGNSNENGSHKCRACGAALIGRSNLQSQGTAPVGRFQALLEAARGVLEEHQDSGYLLKQLADMENGLELARKAEGSHAPAGSGAAQYSQGLQALGKGLELLHRFAGQPDRELYRAATDHLNSASELLQASQRELASQ